MRTRIFPDQTSLPISGSTTRPAPDKGPRLGWGRRIVATVEIPVKLSILMPVYNEEERIADAL
ncbi:glycosyltransferase, partial [Micromonospora sp. NPDC047465]|uniref:glycosyltransferase n=1 Tax=Micromonospora sp. NPDC047465 TaxID=3154813 RepID=UPI0033DB3DE5